MSEKIRKEVESSFIREVVYIKDENKLIIEIENGTGIRSYLYKNVSRNKFDRFMDYDSKGEFYNANFKGDEYHEPVSLNGMLESL